ncbi:MAG: phosphoribosylamine--glycine ligase [Muribaculaceae bacterium]|nr:phosphoribosylamine--glycine ligase [Muribaculaceae bacterium]
MNILLLGSGGRECAIAWKLSQSPRLDHLYIAPGNPGTTAFGTNLPVSPNDFEAVAQAALEHEINMLVVGNEDPLVAGIADHFHDTPLLQHIMVVGPSRLGAQLEGSKAFAKEFMQRHGIPTAAHLTVTHDNVAEGIAFLQSLQPPFVLKASGLAAGKGVLIIDTLDEAKAQLTAMLDGKFGSASQQVVIEQYLTGVECSVFVLTDGHDYLLLPEAKDYKRVGVGDSGLNTGGMGSVSPVPFADADFMQRVRQRIIEPTIAGLQSEELPYCGFIFFGLMNVDGDPYVIEYNVRMGDPETQSVMPRIQGDLVDALEAAATGHLADINIGIDPRTCATVILTAGGYPEAYHKGDAITGIDSTHDCIVFQAGTKLQGDMLTTNGGRVLAVTAYGDTMQDALRLAYDNVRSIHFDNAYYRSDIGKDILN